MKQWSLAVFGSEGPLYTALQMELKMRSINDNEEDEEEEEEGGISDATPSNPASDLQALSVLIEFYASRCH